MKYFLFFILGAMIRTNACAQQDKWYEIPDFVQIASPEDRVDSVDQWYISHIDHHPEKDASAKLALLNAAMQYAIKLNDPTTRAIVTYLWAILQSWAE